MKKLLTLALSAFVVFGLSSCAGPKGSGETEAYLGGYLPLAPLRALGNYCGDDR